MRRIISILFLAMLISGCNNQGQKKDVHNNHETKSNSEEAPKKKPLSPHTSTMAMVGDAHIHIDYSSPGVRDRIIFGGLLAYDQVWQAGAHMATWIESNKDLEIDGKFLPAGKYGFFTIPSKDDDWTIIFNSNWDQHGKDEYDEKDDVMRFKVEPIISNKIKEHLEYQVTKINDDEGTISMTWEKVSVRFNFKVNQ